MNIIRLSTYRLYKILLRRITYCIVLLCGFINTMVGQDYRIFQNYHPDATVNTVNCFVQDQTGMIWMGTEKGLYRFDGFRFFPQYTLGHPSNSRIYCALSYNNQIWLGADNGLHLFNPSTQTYQSLPVEGLPTDIRTMASTAHRLWLGSLNGLYALDLNTYQLINYTSKLKDLGLHPAVYALTASTTDELYIGTYNGCAILNMHTGNLQVVPLIRSGAKTNLLVNTLVEDKKRQQIWIGTEGKLFAFGLLTRQVISYHNFPENSVKTFVLDNDNRLLIGTDNGLYIYNGESFEHRLHNAIQPTSLTDNIVWGLFMDKSHNIWLGTDNGLSLAVHTDGYHWTPISDIVNSTDGNRFYSLFRSSNGTYWLGGTNGIIRTTRLSSAEGVSAWYNMGNPQLFITHNRVRDIFEDRSQQIWIATDGNIHRYNPSSDRFIHYQITDKQHRYNSNWAYSIVEDNRNQLWIATCLGGIFVCDKDRLSNSIGKTYIADYHLSTDNGLTGMYITQLGFDSLRHRIWALSFDHGISKLNVIDSRTYQVNQLPKSIHQHIIDKRISYLLVDRSGTVWLGFKGGYLKVSPDFRITEKNIVANQEADVLSMEEVDQHIWFSLTNGIWSVDKQTGQIVKVTVDDHHYLSMFYDAPEQQLLLGSIDGIEQVNPKITLRTQQYDRVTISALTVNGQSRTFDHLPSGEISIRLPFDENNLTFEISDLPYGRSSLSQYVYRIEDTDEQWNFLPNGENRIQLLHLQPGEYRISVANISPDGQINQDESITISVYIRPPWYQSTWAKLIYTLLIIGLIIWVIQYYNVRNRLRIERIEKEQMLEQVRLKMAFFAHISHELKTPLSLIITPISRLLHTRQNSADNAVLESVRDQALIMNELIHNTLDIERIDEREEHLLIPSLTHFNDFLADCTAPFITLTKEKKQLLTISLPEQPIYTEIDLVKMHTVVSNLLSNAIKYTPEGGNIRVTLTADHEVCRLSISDDGIGISPDEQPLIFQRFFQSSRTKGNIEGTGIGLYLAKTYTELHHGTLEVESAINAGSTFTLTLPITTTTIHQNTPSELNTEDNEKPLIVIADDQPDICRMVADILTSHYRCNIVYDGKEALAKCQDELPALVITDYMMPRMDGIEMAHRLKGQLATADIPIILMTGVDDPAIERKSLQNHIDAFITKPFDAELLLLRVQQLIHRQTIVEKKQRMESLITPQTTTNTLSADELFIQNVVQVIEQSIAEPELNVNYICERLSVSNKQLYRKMKQLTGMSPIEYIKSIRMKKAAMLLERKTFSVAEVMYMVGFSNHSYFSKCFQAEFGKTPKQYIEESGS